LEARRFAIEEAARLYQVPPPIIGDLSHGTFTNSETLIRFFAQSTISTWCRKIEAEIRRSLFSTAARRTHMIEFDMSALLRGSPTERWQTNEIAKRNGILTANEIRDLEGFGPIEGGDVLAQSSAASPAASGATADVTAQPERPRPNGAAMQ
jgi:HK97 family phage portal protein